MSKIKKILQKFYVPDADIDALLDAENEMSDDDFKKVIDTASGKYQKHFEAEILPKRIEDTRTETFKKSQLKSMKQANKKLNLGMTNSEMEEFESFDAFMDKVEESVEDSKKGLREGAESATLAELTKIKVNYADLQSKHDNFIKKHDDEIAEVTAKGAIEVERTLARSKYVSVVSKKKIDMDIPGITRTMNNIREELFKEAIVDRDGNITSKDKSPFMRNDRMISNVDEYLDQILKEEELVIVNNVDKTPRSYKDTKKDKNNEGESDAVKKKRKELEASKSRSNNPDPNARKTRF